MTIEIFLAVISFGLSAFGLGYAIGKDHSKKQ